MTETQASQAVTFEQLSQALAHLGFEKHDAPEFTMFRNAEFDAGIVLPREDTLSDVRPLHLAAARATVAGKGITTSADFDRLLTQARQTGTHQEMPRAAGYAMRSAPFEPADAAVPKKKAKKRSRLQAA